MAQELHQEGEPDGAMRCQIRLKGHLGRQWSAWFGGLSITLEANGDTVLSGLLADQAALYGVLKKIRDLGMFLLVINCAREQGG
jgi:hypothetical protein